MVPFPWVLLFISSSISLFAFAVWVRGLLPKNRERLKQGREDFYMDAEHFAGGEPDPHKLEVRPKSKTEIFYIIHTAARMAFMCTFPFVLISIVLLFLPT